MSTVPYSELKRLRLKLASPRLTACGAFTIHQRARELMLATLKLQDLAYEACQRILAKDLNNGRGF